MQKFLLKFVAVCLILAGAANHAYARPDQYALTYKVLRAEERYAPKPCIKYVPPATVILRMPVMWRKLSNPLRIFGPYVLVPITCTVLPLQEADRRFEGLNAYIRFWTTTLPQQ